MQHLEEGTIHAWLDGALPADESARVEQHVKDCAECAAMVADARGLIAGAARIVSALDIVPGGVIPPKQSAAPAGGSMWRTLRLSPFRAALAASLMVAVASLFAVKGGREGPQTAFMKLDSAAPIAAAAPAVTTPATPPSPAPQVRSAPVSAAAEGRAQRPRNEAPAPVVAKVEDQAKDVARQTQPAEKIVAQAPEAPRRALDTTRRADSLAQKRVIGSGVLALSEVVVTAADSAKSKVAPSAAAPAVPMAGAGGRGGAGGSADIAARRAAPSGLQLSATSDVRVLDFAGCYQIADSADWPRALPTKFALVSQAGPTGARNLVRRYDGRVRGDSTIIGAWRRVTPQLVSVSLDSTVSGAFSLTLSAGGFTAQPLLPSSKPARVTHTTCP